MRVLLLLVLFIAYPIQAETLPPGPFPTAECLDCHQEKTPDIVEAWRTGPHRTPVAATGCVTCHGDLHAGAAARARRPQTCIGCHGGPNAPAVRSYSTSKHGVIATIEGDQYDLSKRLADANYRAPSCAYCHFYDGGHGAAMTTLDACYDCHSPRYANTLFEAGRRGIDVGLLKVQEAEEAVADWRRQGKLTAQEGKELDALLRTMRDGPLTSLRLGTAHQSPDYQWWFGQAALDGALLRIKARLSRIIREKALKER